MRRSSLNKKKTQKLRENILNRLRIKLPFSSSEGWHNLHGQPQILMLVAWELTMTLLS